MDAVIDAWAKRKGWATLLINGYGLEVGEGLSWGHSYMILCSAHGGSCFVGSAVHTDVRHAHTPNK